MSNGKVRTKAKPPVSSAGASMRKRVPKRTVRAVPNRGAVESVIAKATDVIGDKDDAMRWLGTPIPALNYATPISLLGSKDGITRVEDVLGRMESGVW